MIRLFDQYMLTLVVDENIYEHSFENTNYYTFNFSPIFKVEI